MNDNRNNVYITDIPTKQQKLTTVMLKIPGLFSETPIPSVSRLGYARYTGFPRFVVGGKATNSPFEVVFFATNESQTKMSSHV